ncbi:Tetratricopeptide repeat protein [Novipirellula aureliae]|uniref:Tetratricopeptide repeat protein n=1 Tax=Novipirellula aureliae TaxID=2527966 RepID=A0A5C6E234_9BACT|nr:tetratricopeptide repeat protein [Novipirellula aureliae]TWU42960.1 Tetratricopeptide repeat protein [Novipirellula aureliae]
MAHNHLGALLNLGVIAANQQQSRKAIDHFEQVLELEPKHLAATFNLSAMHESIGESEQAQRYFQRAEQSRKDAGFELVHFDF